MAMAGIMALPREHEIRAMHTDGLAALSMQLQARVVDPNDTARRNPEQFQLLHHCAAIVQATYLQRVVTPAAQREREAEKEAQMQREVQVALQRLEAAGPQATARPQEQAPSGTGTRRVLRVNAKRKEIHDLVWARLTKGETDPVHRATFGKGPHDNLRLRVHQRQIARRIQELQAEFVAAGTEAVERLLQANPHATGPECLEACQTAARGQSRSFGMYCTGAGKALIAGLIATTYDNARQQFDPARVGEFVARGMATAARTLIVSAGVKDIWETGKEGIHSSWHHFHTHAASKSQREQQARVTELGNAGLVRDGGLSKEILLKVSKVCYELDAQRDFDKHRFRKSCIVHCTAAMAAARFECGDFKVGDFDCIMMDEADALGQGQDITEGRDTDVTSLSWGSIFARLGSTAIFCYLSGTDNPMLEGLKELGRYTYGDALLAGEACGFTYNKLGVEGLVLNEGTEDEWTVHTSDPMHLSPEQTNELRRSPEAWRAYMRFFVKHMLLAREDPDGPGPVQGLVLVDKGERAAGNQASVVQRVHEELHKVVTLGAEGLFEPSHAVPSRDGPTVLRPLVTDWIHSSQSSAEKDRKLAQFVCGDIDILVGDDIPRRNLDNAWLKNVLNMRKHPHEKARRQDYDDDDPAHRRSELLRVRDYRRTESNYGQGMARAGRILQPRHASGPRAAWRPRLQRWLQQYGPGGPLQEANIFELLSNDNEPIFTSYLNRQNASHALTTETVNALAAEVNLPPGVRVSQDTDMFDDASSDDEGYSSDSSTNSIDSKSSSSESDTEHSSHGAGGGVEIVPSRRLRQRLNNGSARPVGGGNSVASGRTTGGGGGRNRARTAEEVEARDAARQRRQSQRAQDSQQRIFEEQERRARSEALKLARAARARARSQPVLQEWVGNAPELFVHPGANGAPMLRVRVQAPYVEDANVELRVVASTHRRATAQDPSVDFNKHGVWTDVGDKVDVTGPGQVDIVLRFQTTWNRIAVRAHVDSVAVYGAVRLIQREQLAQQLEAQLGSEPSPADPVATVTALPALPAAPPAPPAAPPAPPAAPPAAANNTIAGRRQRDARMREEINALRGVDAVTNRSVGNFVAEPSNSLVARGIGNQPFMALVRETQVSAQTGCVRLGPQTLHQSVERREINGQQTRRRPGQSFPQAVDPAQRQYGPTTAPGCPVLVEAWMAVARAGHQMQWNNVLQRWWPEILGHFTSLNGSTGYENATRRVRELRQFANTLCEFPIDASATPDGVEIDGSDVDTAINFVLTAEGRRVWAAHCQSHDISSSTYEGMREAARRYAQDFLLWPTNN